MSPDGILNGYPKVSEVASVLKDSVSIVYLSRGEQFWKPVLIGKGKHQ